MPLRKIPKGTVFVGSLEKPALKASLKDRAFESSKKSLKGRAFAGISESGASQNEAKIELKSMQNPAWACLWQHLAAQRRSRAATMRPRCALKPPKKRPRAAKKRLRAPTRPKTRPRHARNPPKSSSAGSKAPPACNLHKELRLKAFIIDF